MDKKINVTEKSTKFDECVEKGSAIVEPKQAAVKTFFTEKVPEGAHKAVVVAKKALPFVVGIAIGVVGGVALAGRPLGVSDEELDDAGVDLDGQTPDADYDSSNLSE